MKPDESLAVLVSGGLDSAILLGESLRQYESVYPLYVRTGLCWEPAELAHLQLYLGALAGPRLQPLRILEQPVADLYGNHWSLTGEGVPRADTPDDAVFLPGRNVLLLSKALLWCLLQGVPALALATLESNPFPDASPAFFDAFARLVSESVNGKVRVVLPYEHLHKVDVIRGGRDLPLEKTFSCIHPVKGMHCGGCNKCAERKRAFLDAGMADPTAYGEERACTA